MTQKTQKPNKNLGSLNFVRLMKNIFHYVILFQCTLSTETQNLIKFVICRFYLCMESVINNS